MSFFLSKYVYIGLYGCVSPTEFGKKIIIYWSVVKHLKVWQFSNIWEQQ